MWPLAPTGYIEKCFYVVDIDLRVHESDKTTLRQYCAGLFPVLEPGLKPSILAFFYTLLIDPVSSKLHLDRAFSEGLMAVKTPTPNSACSPESKDA